MIVGSTKQAVYAALDNAKVNGYWDLFGWAPEDICNDLTDCDADLEAFAPAGLLPHVKAYLADMEAQQSRIRSDNSTVKPGYKGWKK